MRLAILIFTILCLTQTIAMELAGNLTLNGQSGSEKLKKLVNECNEQNLYGFTYALDKYPTNYHYWSCPKNNYGRIIINNDRVMYDDNKTVRVRCYLAR